ncbi:hypothetical protein ACFE04_016041 [Oxalis oulophora]
MIRDQFRGGSLPVDNVQALAAKNLQDVPLRYIRPENQDVDILVNMDDKIEIPVIDMSKLLVNKGELSKLHSACKDWGFFQLINHGVGEDVMDKMKKDIAEFFALPLEEKMILFAYEISDSGLQLPILSGILFGVIPSQIYWCPKNGSSLGQYSSDVQEVSKCLWRMMAKNLGLYSEKLLSLFEDGNQGIRMNYYPPCPQPDKVIGNNPHSDVCGITLLTQTNEVQGLQIKKDSKWLPVKPIPGAFIVNIGDIIEIMSNGEYKSIEHRAVVNKAKERLSIAAFNHPNMETMIGPLKEILKDDKAALYKSLAHDEYLRLVFSCKRDGKNRIEVMKL